MGTGSVELLDWRRRTGELYAAVRALGADPSAGGPAAAHTAWRAGRDALFADHPQSPLPVGDPRRRTGLPVAPYDPALRFTAPLVPETGGPQLALATGTDGTVAFTRLGRVELPVGPLDVWWLDGYGGGVWLPVRDASGGATSYGGGRYLLDTVKGADLGTAGQAGPDGVGRDGSRGSGGGSGPRGAVLVLDLNFLYNPSCAYDEAWACPLAPPGNRLDVGLEVGEAHLR